LEQFGTELWFRLFVSAYSENFRGRATAPLNAITGALSGKKFPVGLVISRVLHNQFHCNSHLYCLPTMALYRIDHGNLYADILLDRRNPTDIWIYVIQRQGSPEILAMGSCSSEAEARRIATDALKHYIWSPKKAVNDN
jgi:hypothetical protein